MGASQDVCSCPLLSAPFVESCAEVRGSWATTKNAKGHEGTRREERANRLALALSSGIRSAPGGWRFNPWKCSSDSSFVSFAFLVVKRCRLPWDTVSAGGMRVATHGRQLPVGIAAVTARAQQMPVEAELTNGRPQTGMAASVESMPSSPLAILEAPKFGGRSERFRR